MKQSFTTRREAGMARLLAHGGRCFDSERALLLLPITAYRNKHVEHLPKDALRHPVRESLYYALALLAAGGMENVERAVRILGKIVALQNRGEGDATRDGLWSYFEEEPAAVARTVDINWADFIGMGLCVCVARFESVLPSGLTLEMREAISRAAAFIRRRNVDLNYTNVAIKGTLVVLVAAELAADDDLLGYARERLSRLRALIETREVLTEYNSPAYAGVNLAGLHAMECIVRDPAARDDITALLHRLWNEVALRFHPGTGELAGPHARAYAPTLEALPGWLGPLIEQVTVGRFCYDTDDDNLFDTIWPLVLDVNAPVDVVERLTSVNIEARGLSAATMPWPNEASRVLTTWIEPAFCLGSVAFQDGWEQHHNLIAYWRSAGGKTAWLRHRYLNGVRPCCSGYFSAVQRGRAVEVGAFPGSFADDHVLSPVDAVETAFLGAVVELETAGERPRVILNGRALPPGQTSLSIGDRLRVELATVVLEVELTHHMAAPGSVPTPRVEWMAGERLRLVLPHHEGERRLIRWLDLGQAASGYRLRMAAAGDALPMTETGGPMLPPCVLPRWELERWAIEWIGERGGRRACSV